MPTRSATWLLFRDELIGFAKSKVMLVLWLVLPALAIGGYLLLPDELIGARTMDGGGLSATAFLSFIFSSAAGTVAALMVAVDIVSERNRKVFELFVIRPIRREAIIWSKTLAVIVCVTVACLVALLAGIVIDAIAGQFPTGDALYDMVKAVVSLIGVLLISASAGALFGVLSRSVVVAVVLVLYVGQNLTFVPMLPVFLGVLPNLFWLLMAISCALAVVLTLGAGVIFRRSEL
jgi:ABC-2 type transport system permease protein